MGQPRRKHLAQRTVIVFERQQAVKIQILENVSKLVGYRICDFKNTKHSKRPSNRNAALYPISSGRATLILKYF